MALINTRSLINKTLILSDLFSTQNLDFLFLTETWLCPGDLRPFSELLPSKCLFFYSPCTTGRDGGLVSNNKDHFTCRLVPSNYSSFELQLFVLELGDPLFIVVIYQPPNYNTNFLTEFAEFLGNVSPKYDKLLVLWDFNVHICCMNDRLAKEFTHSLNAFDFSIGVNAPTHKDGHTLDLVFLI